MRGCVPPVFTYSYMLRAYPSPDTTRSFLDPFYFSAWNDAEEASLMCHTSGLDNSTETTSVARGGGAVGAYYMGTATRTFNNLKQLTQSLIPTLAHFICSLFPPRLTDDPGRPPETGATHPVPPVFTYLCMLRAYPPPDTTRYVFDHFRFSQGMTQKKRLQFFTPLALTAVLRLPKWRAAAERWGRITWVLRHTPS